MCLQSLGAIETEEEYALADEAFFGDLEALGLRKLPCDGGHVVCARCCKSWLRLVSLSLRYGPVTGIGIADPRITRAPFVVPRWIRKRP